MELNEKNNILDLSSFRMITGVKSKDNKLILEINKNYECEVEIPYNVDIEDDKIIINEHPLKVENIKRGILNLISLSISQNLVNKITNRRTYYIAPPIPLIGHTAFGLIDRGTNIIQVRGLSGCNINCPFCSVDEGKHSKTRKNDYYVDVDYLVEEYKKIVEFKGNKFIEAHLDGQGEPTLYYPLADLVQNLSEINKEGKGIVSMQSNGVGLTYKMIDELEEAGLHRINLSINALDEKMAKILAGRKDYNIEKILDIAEYIKNSKIHLLIAPILLPNVNDEEVKKVIDYAIELDQRIPQNVINPITNKKDPILGVQLCLIYQFGRRVKKMKIWEFKKFYKLLKDYEAQYGAKGIDVKLKLHPSDFGTHRRKKLPCPFKVGEVVNVDVVMDGRIKGEVIGVAKNRIVQIINCKNEHKLIGNNIRVKILRTKDNIIVSTPV
ncbi:radical SAM protein [Methanotorris igneus]|uniref:Radical SAM domain protein n=1 Tax=Methanotorris igneus (strain DSM 5666 / JCM 11834 / Kol 5) TaxID=880724 RepID=F6BB21_METIK|nr:radical SAM protein [Methanotorris igneus]AEF97108.1 Radical SAM domain protein [Methanotorris igneus Kol 5]